MTQPIQNKPIFFPPSIVVGETPFVPMEEIVEDIMRQLITVSDQTGDPVIKAQAITFQKNIQKVVVSAAIRFALNERARTANKLRELGFSEAAEALKTGFKMEVKQGGSRFGGGAHG